MIESYLSNAAQVLFRTLFIRIIRTTLIKPTPFFLQVPPLLTCFLAILHPQTHLYIYIIPQCFKNEDAVENISVHLQYF